MSASMPRNEFVVKLFVIAIMFSMAISAVPMAIGAESCGCETHEHDVCEHSHDASECGHCHAGEACACGHNHDEAGHDDEAETLTALTYPGDEIYSVPSPTKPSGFPVWIDQSHTADWSYNACGMEITDCPVCNAGTVPCGTCGGTTGWDCTDCGADGWVDCSSCGGDGWEDCTICGGDGEVDCSTCSGTGGVPCTMCGGDGDDGGGPGSCTYCSGTGSEQCMTCFGMGTVSCMSCSGWGGWTCMTCGGPGGWDCTTCGADGWVTCPTCSGAGDLGECGNCGADGNLELDRHLAQTFTPSATGQLEKIRMKVVDPLSLASMHAAIFTTDGAGVPLAQLSAETVISGDDVGSTAQWIDITFPGSIVLTGGTKYAIVMGGDTMGWIWRASVSNGSYAGGKAFWSTDGATWFENVGDDQDFETYMTAVHSDIYDIQDLQDIDLNLTGNYELMNDIDASATATWNGGLGFDPIGDPGTGSYFKGILQGNGYTVSDLHINRAGQDMVGLFSVLNLNSVVNDTHLTVSISGREGVGGLAGQSDAWVGNCSVAGTVTGTNWVGGLIGYSITQNVDIRHSHSDCAVSGDNYVGGFIGTFSGMFSNITYCSSRGTVSGYDYVGGFGGSTDHSQAKIMQCFSTAEVTGNSTVGGFSGFNYLAIRDCYATGDVDAVDRVGGMVGWCDGTVDSSYSTGHVTGTTNTDAFIGRKEMGSTGNSYYDRQTSGIWTPAVVYAIPQTTSELLTQSTYIPWDFTNVWWMVDGHTRPFLRMEWSEEITNSHQLQMMDLYYTEDYSLESDIDLSEVTEPSQMWGTSSVAGLGWYPVAHDNAYSGTFLGNNHTISNLFINWSDNAEGLFGVTDFGGMVRDVSLTGANLTVGDWSGILVGHANTDIANCHVQGTVTGLAELGGLVGYNGQPTQWCSADASVTGTGDVGGLIGSSSGCTISYSWSTSTVTATGTRAGGLVGNLGGASQMSFCYASGDVTGPTGAVDTRIGGAVGDMNGNSGASQCYATGNVVGGNYVGGFVGRTFDADATNCYARGSVTGTGFVGGFAGIHQASGDDIIQLSYSTGQVTGSSNTGGFCGMNSGAIIAGCYYDTETSGLGVSAGGVAKTTAEMKQQATFAGWNFGNTWGIVENVDYPVLRALCRADLEISITPNMWTGLVGPAAVGYEVRLENHGPDPAFGAYISVHLPNEMSVFSTSPPATSNVAGYVNWTGGNLTAGYAGLVYVMTNINTYAPTLTVQSSTSSTTADPGIFQNDDTITVNVNRAPAAVNDAFTVKADEMLNVAAPGLIANDADPDGNGLTISGTNFVGTDGVVTNVDPNGAFEYDPRGVSAFVALDMGQSGFDYFNYTVTDGLGGLDTAMVTITVTGVNDAPAITTADITASAVNVLYSADYDATDPEGDTLTWSVSTNATWLTMGWATGVLAGTPNTTHSGKSFWVHVSVSDGALMASTNFTITVGIDTDGDGTPDATDTDDDGDGVPDSEDDFPMDPAESVDTDGDGTGDVADTDDDGDGVADAADDFPMDPNETVDTDDDGTGNNADTDDDGDSVPDASDDFPLDPAESNDNDGDGLGDNADTDDDDDGVPDTSDDLPFDEDETVDTDGDGEGNNGDTDDDGDSVPDASDDFPLNPAESADTDSDGTGNNADTDDDGDGVADTIDDFPMDATETLDTDGDGIGNNADTDDDGDSVADSADDFPTDSNETTDTDDDGIGNNADTDDDGDDIPDSEDTNPLVPDDGDADDDTGGSNMMLYLIIIIIIVAVVAVAAIALRPKGPKPLPAPPEAVQSAPPEPAVENTQ